MDHHTQGNLDLAAQDLEICLKGELEAVLRFQAAEQEVKSALSKRDWILLEASIAQVQNLAEELEAWDQRRETCWKGLKNSLSDQDLPTDFYSLVARLPQEHRQKLTELRRQLKVAVVGAKGLTSGLEDYVNITGKLIQGVLQEARPSLKGRLYSPRGEIRPSGAASLVLDRQF